MGKHRIFLHFRIMSTLPVHLKMQHELGVNYLCGKGFPGNSSIRTHVTDHGGRRKKKPKPKPIEAPSRSGAVFLGDYFQ